MTWSPIPPDPNDVSTDYLIKPTPPDHEFRFRVRTLLLTMLVVSLVMGMFRLVVLLLR